MTLEAKEVKKKVTETYLPHTTYVNLIEFSSVYFDNQVIMKILRDE